MKTPTRDYLGGRPTTRRTVVLGGVASLLCAPVFGQAEVLTPVRGLPVEPVTAGFCQRLMYRSLAHGLEAGRMSTVLNGKVVRESEAGRMVANARAHGWIS
jgi:hypothetical protein